MKMKRILGVILAAIMLIGTLAGCGPKGKLSEAAKQYVETDEKLTLTWLGYPGCEGKGGNSAPELLLEEKFNVDIEPIFYGWGETNQKKVLLLASGVTPDLMIQMDPANLFTDVEQDYIAELPYETLKMYAPELTKYITEYIPNSWITTRYDGKNWGIPNYNHSHETGNTAIWRKDWLDKFGLEVPETLDEMHDAFVKFSKEDPDGNGKNDTWGITTGLGTKTHTFNEIFGAFGVNPYGWMEIDGEIEYGGLQDGVKEAIKILAAWYKEGLIHPDFYTPGTADDNFFASGKVGYALTGYHNPASASSVIGKLKANFPDAETAYGKLPKGPDGKYGAFSYTAASNAVSFGNGEGYEKKVPRMLKMFETIFTDLDLYTELSIGKEGVSWEKTAPDTNGSLSYKFIGDYTTDTSDKGYSSAAFYSPMFFTLFPPKHEEFLATRSDAWKAWYNEYDGPEAYISDEFGKTDICPSSPDYDKDLRDNQYAVILEIIVGQKTIDDYAEFENAFEKDGGTILLEEARQIKEELEQIHKELK